MHPLVYIAVGLLAFFYTKKAPAATLRPLPVDPPAPSESQISVPIPAGWRRTTPAEVTTALAGDARDILNAHGSEPYGTFIPIDSENAALIEQHYHEPGGPVKPWGYHHGVTLLTRTT